MNIFLVEDKIDEISGYLQQFENSGWRCDRLETFGQGYNALVEREEFVDLFIIDIMLPWGSEVDDETERLLDWKQAGIYLIYAIRGIENKELEGIRRRSKLAKDLSKDYRSVPIIALTKIREAVEEEVCDIPRVSVMTKLDGLNVRQLPLFARKVEERTNGDGDSEAPTGLPR